MIPLPIGLVKRISELLHDIATMKSSSDIYDKSREITKDLLYEVEAWEKSFK